MQSAVEMRQRLGTDRLGAGEGIIQRIVLAYLDVKQTCRLRLRIRIFSVVQKNVTHCCTPSVVTDDVLQDPDCTLG